MSRGTFISLTTLSLMAVASMAVGKTEHNRGIRETIDLGPINVYRGPRHIPNFAAAPAQKSAAATSTSLVAAASPSLPPTSVGGSGGSSGGMSGSGSGSGGGTPPPPPAAAAEKPAAAAAAAPAPSNATLAAVAANQEGRLRTVESALPELRRDLTAVTNDNNAQNFLARNNTPATFAASFIGTTDLRGDRGVAVLERFKANPTTTPDVIRDTRLAVEAEVSRLETAAAASPDNQQLQIALTQARAAKTQFTTAFPVPQTPAVQLPAAVVSTTAGT